MIERTAVSLLLFAACRGAQVERPTDPGPEAVGAISAGPRAESPAEGKTYASEEFGFSFQYPADLVVSENRGEETSPGALLLTVRLLGPEESDPALREHAIGRFSVAVLGNPEKLAVRDFLDTYGWPFGPGEGATSTEVGGVPALDVTTGRMLAPNRFLYVSWNEVVLRMAPTGAESDRILRSFRFLE